jgi:hypothetical protein
MQITPGPQTAAWRALEADAARLRARHARELIAADTARFA